MKSHQGMLRTPATWFEKPLIVDSSKIHQHHQRPSHSYRASSGRHTLAATTPDRQQLGTRAAEHRLDTTQMRPPASLSNADGRTPVVDSGRLRRLPTFV